MINSFLSINVGSHAIQWLDEEKRTETGKCPVVLVIAVRTFPAISPPNHMAVLPLPGSA